MFKLIAPHLETLMAKQAAPKLTLVQQVKAAFRRWNSKRAYEALKVSLREEKAAIAKTNTELANEMEARVDALIAQSALCKRTDPVESERLFDEAVELSTQATNLRYAI